MKFLVLLACVAVSKAQLLAHPNGAVVPIDEPAVQIERANHLAAHGVYAPPYAHGFRLNPADFIRSVGAAHLTATPLAAAHLAALPTLAAPVPVVAPLAAAPLVASPTLLAHPNGAIVPIDEPAVQIERANHLAAHGIGARQYAYGYGLVPQDYIHPIVFPNGAVVPVDTPAVMAARADHLAALAALGATAA